VEIENDRPVGPSGSEPVGEHVRIYRRGKIWHANYQAAGKQWRVSLKTSNKKVAQRKALRIDTELSTGQWKRAIETKTVEHAVAAYTDYLRAEDRSPKTLAKYVKVFATATELAKKRGVKDLSGIDLTFIDAYRRMRTDAGAQAKNRYTECVIIRQLITFSLSRDLVEIDPLRGLKLTKPKPTKQPCWTREEVLNILAASPPMERSAFILLAETGMRFGELQWLTWDDIDLKQKTSNISAKENWKPKTGDERSVPLSEAAFVVLTALPRSARWVVTMPPTDRLPKLGQQWTERRLLTNLKAVLKGIGFIGKLHTFRHSFISHALLCNIPAAVVRKWVGHVDQRTIDLYTHVHDVASRVAMDRLSKIYTNVRPKQEREDERENGSAQK